MEQKHSARACFAVHLRFRVSDQQRRIFFRTVLADHGGLVGGVPLRVYTTKAVDSDRHTRLRSVNPQVLNDLVVDLACRRINSAGLSDRKYQTSLPSDDVPFSLDVGEFQDRELGLVQSLKITGPPELCDWEQVRAYFRLVTESIACTYGHAMGAEDFIDVMSQSSFTPISLFVPGQPNRSDPVADELRFYQRNERELDRFIPKAYWGNILSPKHIEGLGGEERIRQKSGCYRVERWGENLFLQATPSMWDLPATALERLNDFLAPIRFPGAPEPSLI